MKLPIEELKATIFHSMMQSFKDREDELSDNEIKSIIFNSIHSIPDFKVQWGKNDKFGKNRIIVIHQNRIAILDLNLLIHFIKDVWHNYLIKVVNKKKA